MSKFSIQQKIGFLFLILLFTVGIGEQLFFNGDPTLQDLNRVFEHPSLKEPLGTDQFGRSNLSRIASAIRTSVLMAFFSVSTSAILGLFLGVLAGWKKGWVDRILAICLNILLALPGLILVLLFGALVPGSFLILYMI
ncbi:MAG: ABC transporter permease, partial [Proteobacteria bacterium]|nr:ABC transporter permease [Pseudomonadota bacterium]